MDFVNILNNLGSTVQGKITSAIGDEIRINLGSNSGLKIGDTGKIVRYSDNKQIGTITLTSVSLLESIGTIGFFAGYSFDRSLDLFYAEMTKPDVPLIPQLPQETDTIKMGFVFDATKYLPAGDLVLYQQGGLRWSNISAEGAKGIIQYWEDEGRGEGPPDLRAKANEAVASGRGSTGNTEEGKKILTNTYNKQFAIYVEEIKNIDYTIATGLITDNQHLNQLLQRRRDTRDFISELNNTYKTKGVSVVAYTLPPVPEMGSMPVKTTKTQAFRNEIKALLNNYQTYRDKRVSATTRSEYDAAGSEMSKITEKIWEWNQKILNMRETLEVVTYPPDVPPPIETDTIVPVITQTDDFNIFKPIITTKPTKPEKPTVKKPINWLLWLGIAGGALLVITLALFLIPGGKGKKKNPIQKLFRKKTKKD